MGIRNIIEDSFLKTKKESALLDKKTGNKEPHSKYSRNWVRILAYELRNSVASDALCFFKGNLENKSEFNITEYLHDIVVCTTDTVLSAKHKAELQYVHRVQWQVESELIKNRDGRQILQDFNKLILGSAFNKLLVTSNISFGSNDEFLKFLSVPARVCAGNLYLAMIPHPKDWWNNEPGIEVFEYANKWKPAV